MHSVSPVSEKREDRIFRFWLDPWLNLICDIFICRSAHTQIYSIAYMWVSAEQSLSNSYTSLTEFN